MAEKRKHRVPIMLTREEITAIDDWRYANRVATRSSAIRQLVVRASEAEAKLEKAREALNRLLVCPAIADEDHNDPEWGDGETAEASSFARATLKEIGEDNG